MFRQVRILASIGLIFQFVLPAWTSQDVVISESAIPGDYRPVTTPAAAQALKRTYSSNPVLLQKQLLQAAADIHPVLATSVMESNVVNAPIPELLPQDPEIPVLDEPILWEFIVTITQLPVDWDSLGWDLWIEPLSDALKMSLGWWFVPALAQQIADELGIEPFELRKIHAQETYDKVIRSGGPLGWIMEQARLMDPVMEYRASNGTRVPVYNAYQKPMSAEELEQIAAYLEQLPEDHLLQVPSIVLFPNLEVWGHLGVAHWEHGVGIQGIEEINNEILAHEVGHFLEFNLQGQDRKDWDYLWNRSDYGANDHVHGISYYGDPIFERENGERYPYGASNIMEDYAAIYGDWASNSATPWNNGLSSQQSILNVAIERASQGHPRLLEKVLFIASQFIDSKTGTLRMYHHQNYAWEAPIQVKNVLTELKGNRLVMGDVTFYVEGGHLTGMSSSSLSTQFSVPVEIVPSALQRWMSVARKGLFSDRS